MPRAACKVLLAGSNTVLKMTRDYSPKKNPKVLTTYKQISTPKNKGICAK